MRQPSDRPAQTVLRLLAAGKRRARLTFESLEVRTMLSADAVTSNLVEFSKAAAASAGGRLYAGRNSGRLRLQQRLLRLDDRQRRGPDDRDRRCLQRSEHRLRPGDVRCAVRHRRPAQPESRQSKWRHQPARHRFDRRLGSRDGARRGMGPRHCPRGQHRAGRGQQRFRHQSVCGSELRPGAGRTSRSFR